jgi:hypothetical protein
MCSILVSKEGEGGRSTRSCEMTQSRVTKLQNTRQKELKAASALYKKQQLEEARKAREIDKERKKQEQKAKAERLAVARLEKHQMNAANAANALQLPQSGKRPASQKAASKPKRAGTDMAAVDGAETAEAAPKPTLRGRPINPPKKIE